MKNLKFNTNFSFAGIEIHIHSDNSELFDLAVDYFHNHGSNSEGARDGRIDFYFVKKMALARGRWDLDNWKRHTYTLESWSRDITVRLDYQKGIIRSYLSSQCKFPKEAVEDLLIFRPLSLLLIKNGFFIIHAGCVSENGRGIIIPAGFGRGKTTVTLQLVRKGFKFLSDEYILLKKSKAAIKAYAFPQRIGARKNLVNKFNELKFLENRKDSPHKKKRFWIDEAYPKAFINACCPRLIIVPHFKDNSALKLTRASKNESFFNILKDRENFAINKGLPLRDYLRRQFNILSSLIEQADIFRLEYSNNNLCDLAKVLRKQGFFAKKLR